MKILPPCRDHDKRIEDLERITKGMGEVLLTITQLLKEASGSLEALQAFKDTADQTYTPGEIDQDHTYFR
jgi:hypothetical protein